MSNARFFFLYRYLLENTCEGHTVKGEDIRAQYESHDFGSDIRSVYRDIHQLNAPATGLDTYIGVVIRDHAGETEEGIINFQVMMSETIRAAVPILKPGEKICYTYQKLQGNHTTIDDFIKEMNYIAVNPDDCAEYDPEAKAGDIDPAIF